MRDGGAALANARAALTDDGRFAFETRNPPAREWEQWTPDDGVEVTDVSGAVVRMERQVGNWKGEPLTDTSPEIITIAGRSSRPPRCLAFVRNHEPALPELRIIVLSKPREPGLLEGSYGAGVVN
jgi:hypothetical protein